MININELRRLAQAVIDWSACNQAWLDQSEDITAAVVGRIDEDGNTYPVCTVDCELYYSGDSLPLAKFYAAANPATVSELLDRLEAAEKGRDDVAQQLVQSEQGKRKISEECDELRAKVEAMERQEPYSYIYRYANPLDGSPIWRHDSRAWNGQIPGACKPLYALPGAQNVPNFADAYQGAMEDVATWKRRALEAEDLNRKFIAEINGPTHMGEPTQHAAMEPAMQDALMKFDPATGEERPYPSHATQWRNWHGTAAWLFDPWTGKRRNAHDVGSDVHGLLIVPAGTLGMDMGGGCAEKNNVAAALEAKPCL